MCDPSGDREHREGNLCASLKAPDPASLRKSLCLYTPRRKSDMPRVEVLTIIARPNRRVLAFSWLSGEFRGLYPRRVGPSLLDSSGWRRDHARVKPGIDERSLQVNNQSPTGIAAFLALDYLEATALAAPFSGSWGGGDSDLACNSRTCVWTG